MTSPGNPWGLGAPLGAPFPGLTTNVEGTLIPGLDNGQWFIFNFATSPSTPNSLRVDRNAQYTGGVAGNVSSALWVNATAGTGVVNAEWALSVTLDNHGPGGNVAGFMQATKELDGGNTWAFVAELIDKTSNPATGSVTCEIDHQSTGTDASGLRGMMDFSVGDGVAGHSTVVTFGIRFGGKNGVAANTVTHPIIYQNGTFTDLMNAASTGVYTNGIDLSAASFSGFAFKSLNFQVDAIGNVQTGKFVTIAPQTFASLPASANKGTRAYITDSNTAVFNAIAAGGGTNNIGVVYNGTNWVVG